MLKKSSFLDKKTLENQFIKLVSRSTGYYFNKILKKNKKFSFDKPVVLFGAAKMGIIWVGLCKKNKIKVLSFCDNDKQKQNSFVKDIGVISPRTLMDKYGIDTQIIITSLYDDEIKIQLDKLGFRNVWSHTFFSTVFANNFSILSWTNDTNSIIFNRLSLIECFKMLGDTQSKNVFFNIIRYRLNLDRKYLKLVAGDIRNIYFDKGVYPLSKDEIFVDGGAFDGDTVRLFISVTGNRFKKVYCFEPDGKSCLDLKNFVDKIKDKRIKIVRCGLGLKNKTVFFISEGGFGSKVSSSGEKIKITNIDSFIKDKVTLIKLDVEGCEKEALLGSKKTIAINKPKLAVCVYHNLSDLWDIPLFIKKINPDYRIYLRHYNQFLFDTICYAI